MYGYFYFHLKHKDSCFAILTMVLLYIYVHPFSKLIFFSGLVEPIQVVLG